MSTFPIGHIEGPHITRPPQSIIWHRVLMLPCAHHGMHLYDISIRQLSTDLTLWHGLASQDSQCATMKSKQASGPVPAPKRSQRLHVKRLNKPLYTCCRACGDQQAGRGRHLHAASNRPAGSTAHRAPGPAAPGGVEYDRRAHVLRPGPVGLDGHVQVGCTPNTPNDVRWGATSCRF